MEAIQAAIVGEIEAGQAAKVRKQVKDMIQTLNASTFDIMDLLHEVKTKKFYLPKFETFSEFAETLDMKISKTYYLVRIKERMLAAGIPREMYEPVGVSKLRVIATLEPTDEDGNVSEAVLGQIKELVELAHTKSLDEVKAKIDILQGNVGDEAWDWFNIKIKKAAKTVVKQALSLIKLQIGSIGKDEEGNSKDASDGAALEKLAMDYLSDPNNAVDVEQAGIDTEADTGTENAV